MTAAFSVGWVPHLLTVHGRPRADGLLGRVVVGFMALLILAAVASSGAAMSLIPRFRPASYRSAASLVLPVALGYVAYGVWIVATAGVHVSGKSAVLLAPMVAAATLNLGLNVLLVPRFGGSGAAWSTFASFVLVAGLTCASLRRHLGIRIEPRDAAALAGAFVGALALAACEPAMGPGSLSVTHGVVAECRSSARACFPGAGANRMTICSLPW